MDTTTITGTVGATIILVAFILNQSGKWGKDDFRYDLVNLIGSVILLTYALLLQSWPFVVLNIVWGAFSLKDVVKGLRRPKT